ncbi:L-glutamate gamma-semialdehyde dehydrogenase [Hydrogenibacillus schlegelii]|uniref:L-glutamate gamma-semialdehyde dehydrogenase n=1 Tax=Hydrogenibacillus schlegelii TaxID=1484 RepID=A0A179IPP7_HYDSH|nr:L-glutamate gamma-semialdehyde dehydrogenase [Hydrogenibacillus schlegelii]OAR03434.1 1-pyrroline-5-carboxylate dehydrogenase [Hydrogenibacillus schlegelii]
MMQIFRPEPLTDFSRPENAEAFRAALAKVESELGLKTPLVIGGKEIYTDDEIVSTNPANHRQVIGRSSKATREHAEMALEAAWKAFETWSRIPGVERARTLYKAAAILRRRKHEISAWIVKEAGKSWVEADADTAEAIDFLEYYGREMERYSRPQPLYPLPGEDSVLEYIPLGVGIIIPPWNFPVAILTGMTSGAFVAGNTVILKPASNTPIVAYKLFEILREAGVPDGVVNFLPGSGSEIGDFLVDHPKTRFVSFTGSLEVGVRIYERAAKVQPGQKWLKRVVTEMGGKDAIIVDETADLEAAAQGIVTSAFGFQGQKCSACSRAIVVDAVYDQVLERVIEKTKALKQGDPVDPTNVIGPLIDQSAYEKVLAYIEIGKREGRLVLGGEGDPSTGWYVKPTIFADVDPKGRIAQEEIFGPVLAFIRARDFDHALEIANDTIYGLTGSVYSKDRARIEKARKEFHVGNLYFNRKCTGAIVGVHPFGGFNLSGTNAKTGGPDYLGLFMQLKSSSEVL